MKRILDVFRSASQRFRERRPVRIDAELAQVLAYLNNKDYVFWRVLPFSKVPAGIYMEFYRACTRVNPLHALVVMLALYALDENVREEVDTLAEELYGKPSSSVLEMYRNLYSKQDFDEERAKLVKRIRDLRIRKTSS